MEAPLRALSIYVFLLIVFRIAGKRTLADVTTFDFVLLLIVGEATQQGLIGDDFSVTEAMLLITTLVGIDVALSYIQSAFPRLDRMIESAPLVLLEEGSVLHERLRRSRVAESDIMEAGRRAHGLERMDQIKYAVLERDGAISIIPKADAAWRAAQNLG
jgi:uncharacterized membrane protein YcaP (DUF421 family)